MVCILYIFFTYKNEMLQICFCFFCFWFALFPYFFPTPSSNVPADLTLVYPVTITPPTGEFRHAGVYLGGGGVSRGSDPPPLPVSNLLFRLQCQADSSPDGLASPSLIKPASNRGMQRLAMQNDDFHPGQTPPLWEKLAAPIRYNPTSIFQFVTLPFRVKLRSSISYCP